MSTIFSTLNVGLSSLRAQSMALNVTAHNIANANTPGYSRQRAELGPAPSYAVPGLSYQPQAGQVGTGVEVQQIIQLRDSFLDQQLRQELTLLGGWDQSGDIIQKVELFLNEPSEEGLANALAQFFSLLEDLSLAPDSVAVRENLRQHADILTATFNRLDRQLENYQQDINTSIYSQVEEINDLARRIADLNGQIVRIKANSENPNDLMDQRLLLVEQLAEFVPVQVSGDSRGNLNVSVGGTKLVQGVAFNEIEVRVNADNHNYFDLYWQGTEAKEVRVAGGKTLALLNGRDDIISGFRDDLNLLARTFIREVNDTHAQGYGLDNTTGVDFFTGDCAGTIALNTVIQENINAIAASTAPDTPGNADNVFQLLDLRSQRLLAEDTATFEDFYRSIIINLGVMGQKAHRMTENQGLVVEAIASQRERVAGVSLDEEMANMVRFQHAYTAASRVIVTVDEMIQTLLGIVR